MPNPYVSREAVIKVDDENSSAMVRLVVWGTHIQMEIILIISGERLFEDED